MAGHGKRAQGWKSAGLLLENCMVFFSSGCYTVVAAAVDSVENEQGQRGLSWCPVWHVFWGTFVPQSRSLKNVGRSVGSSRAHI